MQNNTTMRRGREVSQTAPTWETKFLKVASFSYLLIYIFLIVRDVWGLWIIVRNTESDGSPRNRKQWQGADESGSSPQNAEEKAEIRAAGWHPVIVKMG